MVNEVMDFIEKYDPEVGAAIKDEAARQRRNLELIAPENIVLRTSDDGHGNGIDQ